MALEELRARLERLLAGHGHRGSSRAYAESLYRALIDAKVALGDMKDGLAATARELVAERQHLADAERRGTLAEQIGDHETVELARIWTGRHRERVAVLERKQQVQQDELTLAERQLEEWTEAYRQAKAGVIPDGGTPPGPDTSTAPDAELERASRELDRQAKEAKVQEQLAELKRKLGK